MKLLRRKPLSRPAPARFWFRYSDGTYYRNCPLIAAERDEVLAWAPSTPGKHAIIDQLHAEWDATFSRGCQHKPGLDPGDVAAQPAPFHVAYPDKPGLWFLDEDDRPAEPPPAWLREKCPAWAWDLSQHRPVLTAVA